MVKQQLEEFLTEEGYTKISSNLPEFEVFFHIESNYVNIWNVIDYQDGLYLTEDKYEDLKDRIEEIFFEKNIKNIHILSIIICRDALKSEKLCGGDPMCWQIDPFQGKLIVAEKKTEDFYGMRGDLEYKLAHPQNTDGIRSDSDATKKVQMPAKGKTFAPITTFLVAINVIIFIICTFTGDLLYNVGALSVLDLIESKDYYRIITSMFLHWDMDHLFSNMLILYFLGEIAEKYFGKIKYGILYFISGICGNLLSIGYELYSNTYAQSAGASGAIFGVIGCLLFLVIVNKGRIEQITLARLIFMIIYSLYSGIVGSNINNAAHIGGFISGIAAAALLWLFIRKQKNIKKSEKKIKKTENIN